MEFPKPSVENLLSLARYGGKNRLRAAKEISNLDPNVNVEELMLLIDELASDVEDPIFSELGISLSKLIEKMNSETLEEFIEKLLSSYERRLLLCIILSATQRRIDPDLISEVIRRLLNDDSEEIRNGGIGVLRNYMKHIGLREVTDIILELTGSNNREIKCFSTIILTALSNLPNELIESAMLNLLDDEDLEVKKCAVKALAENLIERVAKSRKMLNEVLIKMKTLSKDLINQFLEMVRSKDKIYRLAKTILEKEN